MPPSATAPRPPLLELYIYYRVTPALALQAEQQVRALQTELRARWPDLAARCLHRASEHGNTPHANDNARDNADASAAQTWMEIYTRPGGLSQDDVAIILQRGIELVRSIEGLRHPEVFAEGYAGGLAEGSSSCA